MDGKTVLWSQKVTDRSLLIKGWFWEDAYEFMVEAVVDSWLIDSPESHRHRHRNHHKGYVECSQVRFMQMINEAIHLRAEAFETRWKVTSKGTSFPEKGGIR